MSSESSRTPLDNKNKNKTSNSTLETPSAPLVSKKEKPNGKSDEVIIDKSKVNFTEGDVKDYKFYPDNPEHHRHKYRWANKEPSKFYDPCEESRQASMSCMLRNQEDKTVCQDFFDAYRECKRDFFNKKKKDRRDGKGGWGIW